MNLNHYANYLGKYNIDFGLVSDILSKSQRLQVTRSAGLKLKISRTSDNYGKHKKTILSHGTS